MRQQRTHRSPVIPILPLDHPEPFAATWGVMLYPGGDEADRSCACAFTAQYLAEPIRQLYEAGRSLSQEALVRIVTDGGARLDDLDARWWRGSASGEIFKTLFALAHTDPDLASWENAIKIVECTAAKHKVSGSRTALWAARSRFLSVAPLWAAWSIREGRFETHPEVGYDGWRDFQLFLAEAEILRRWGQSWRPSRAKARPPLPPEVWQVPEGWAPPERSPEWPLTGRIPVLEVPPDLLAPLRKAGRPRKTR